MNFSTLTDFLLSFWHVELLDGRRMERGRESGVWDRFNYWADEYLTLAGLRSRPRYALYFQSSTIKIFKRKLSQPFIGISSEILIVIVLIIIAVVFLSVQIRRPVAIDVYNARKLACLHLDRAQLESFAASRIWLGDVRFCNIRWRLAWFKVPPGGLANVLTGGIYTCRVFPLDHKALICVWDCVEVLFSNFVDVGSRTFIILLLRIHLSWFIKSLTFG